MPADNLGAWKIPPLEPRVMEDKIVGLGVADMKAGLMAGIMAGMVLKDAGIEPPVTVKYASVCDEEGGWKWIAVCSHEWCESRCSSCLRANKL